MPGIVKRVFKVSLVLLAGFIILYFSFRNALLHYVTDNVREKMKNEKGLILEIGSSSFSGYFTVVFGKIMIKPVVGDTLFTADTLRVRPSVSALLTGTLQLKQIFGSGLKLQLVSRSSGVNFKFVSQGNKNEKVSERNRSGGYSNLLAQLLDRAFNLAPQQAEIRNAELKFENDTLTRNIVMNEFLSDKNSIHGEFLDRQSQNIWKCNGEFQQSAHHIDMFIFPEDNTRNELPLIKDLTGASIRFDTMHVVLDGYNYRNKELKVYGLASIAGFSVYHKRISDDQIKVKNASISYSLTADENSLMLDSSSVARLSEIEFNPYLRFEKGASKKYSMKIKMDTIPSTTFFSSLPQGMFDEVRDLEADGTLKFGLDFFIDAANPDSVLFDCSLKKNKFRLRKYGELMKMSGEFAHSVYEYDRYIRTFAVGPSNLYFTPYESVSPYFRNSVLTSEDGNFFFHNGFNEDAFRKSIATNFKARKFLRGGSTISMQLVKNVFLNRKKTVARKAEEALIVWLIESNRLYSKERMLEVYFNIIELGPNVYGIGEASEFYFQKKPAQLNLQESIFLASLLPHPKWFKYSFDAGGNLKPYLSGYYRIVSNFMLRKELITQQEHDNLVPNVQLTGPARELVLPTDTVLIEDQDIF